MNRWRERWTNRPRKRVEPAPFGGMPASDRSVKIGAILFVAFLIWMSLVLNGIL